MAKDEAKIKFTADTKEFNSNIAKANSEMKELRAELKLNATEMKAAGTSAEGLERNHEILSRQLDAARTKTEAMTGKLEAAIRIYGEGSTEVSKWRTQLLNARTEQGKLEIAVAEAADKLQKFKEASQDNRTASEKLNDTIAEQKSKLDQLKQEYSNAVLEHGQLSKEARTLAKEIKAVSSDLDANQKAMAKVEGAADKLDNSLEQVDETAEKVSEGFTVMKGVMADLAADGIEAIASGFTDIAKSAFILTNDVDKATNSFMAKTGESTRRAEEFEDVMVNIYNGNYGESFEDIADSMAIVQTSMGDIDSGELEKMTTDAIVLRDTFDFDVNESVRAAKSLMNQFGITSDEAYSLIAQGAQLGLNQNGDLLDVVNEYAVQFKNAGYSADDMFNSLMRGADTGTWSVDKLGDAVKEFNIRASDGTVSEAIKENAKAFGLSKTEAKNLAKEVETGGVGAYQKLADTLRGIDDDTQRYQLGVAMFGTMWEDLGEEAVLAMFDTRGGISATNDALAEINAIKYDDLGSAFEGIKRNLETSVAEPIKENVMPAVNEFIEDVDWQGVGDTIGEVFGVVAEGALELVNAVKESVQWMNEHKAVVIAVASVVGILTTAIAAYNVVQGIKAAMEAANVTTVWGLVAAHIAQAAAAMAAIAPYVLIVAAIAAVIAIIVLCVKYWDEIVAAVKKAVQAVIEWLSPVGAWIKENVIQPIVEFFKAAWNNIKVVWSIAVDYFKMVWTNIKAVFSVVKEVLVAYFRTAWEGVKLVWSVVVDYFKMIWSNIKQIFSVVKTFFVGMFKSAWAGIQLVWSAATGFFRNIWNTIKGIFSVVKNVLTGNWKDAWAGIKNIVSGWASYFRDIWSKIKNVFSSVKSWFSNTFSAAWSAVKNIWSNVRGFFSNCVNGVKNAFSNVKNIISKPFNAAKDAVKKVVDSIKGFFSKLKLKLPSIKLPHFKLTGKLSLSPPSVPKLKIDWYKDGGIMMNPTIFGMNGNSLMAGGEAGPEAILPIDKLEGYISGAIEKAQNVVSFDSLAAAIQDLANRPVKLSINGREFAQATASAGDSVNGLRTNFKSRGLVLE